MTATLSARRDLIESALEKKWPVSLAFTAVVLLLWQVAGATGALPEYIVTPSSIVAGIADLVSSGELWDLLIPSLKRSFAGFFIGSSLGIVTGLLTGISRPAAELLELPVSFTYPLPKIALFPALAILFGFDDTTRIIVISLACFYPAYLNANLGTRSINPMFVQLAQNVEASRIRTFFQVIVPAALPRIFTGLQICLGVSFILLFATEIIGFSDGVGSDILKSSRDAKYQRMYSGITVLGLAGFLSSRLLLLIGKIATRGRLSGGVVDE